MAMTIGQANAVNTAVKALIGYPGFTREKGIDALVLLIGGASNTLHAGYTPEEARIVLERRWPDAAKLEQIADLEVYGGEFVDAAELYRILDKPIPPPIDHAANIRARHTQ
jgi:hypothetical protein